MQVDNSLLPGVKNNFQDFLVTSFLGMAYPLLFTYSTRKNDVKQADREKDTKKISKGGATEAGCL